jgi:hypothetical protein
MSMEETRCAAIRRLSLLCLCHCVIVSLLLCHCVIVSLLLCHCVIVFRLVLIALC